LYFSKELQIKPYFSLALTMIKKGLAFLLIGLLFGPQLVQLQHAFSGHQHPTCELSKHHLHEDLVDCEFENYNFTPQYSLVPHFAYAPFVVPSHKTPPIYVAPPTLAYALCGVPLRGPPVFS